MKKLTDISYFPGCSLATTAKENNRSLIDFCRHLGYNLVELKDWNCCGSSSAHSIDSGLAVDLAGRNLSLADPGRPLLVACPSCLLRLRQTHLHLKADETARRDLEKKWGRPIDPGLKILHFFEFLDGIDPAGLLNGGSRRLNGLRFVPYYGCMLSRPPEMNREKSYYGLMEKVLASLGGEPVSWSYASRCCGTFLSVARPEVVTPMVNGIVQGARMVGAECIVTACAMCHLNLEIRCTLKECLPVFHFSEVLSLSLGTGGAGSWFSRHLVDPVPLLKSKGLIAD